jgi:hypothetical protein
MDLKLLDEYAPLNFAAFFLSRIPTAQKRDFPLYDVQPRLHQLLFDEIVRVFSITLHVFACDSRGYNRALISTHGSMERVVNVVYVCDTLDFSDPGLALIPTRNRILSRESKAIVEAAIRRLEARMLAPAQVAQVAVCDSSDSSDEAEAEALAAADPLRPPKQRFPMPDDGNRWLLLSNVEIFLDIYPCRLGCGGIFDTGVHRRTHESRHCGYDPTLSSSQQHFTKFRYTTAPFQAQPRIQDEFQGIGYTFQAQALSSKGILTFDLETAQEERTQQLGGRMEVHSVHRLFCLGYAWNLSADPNDMHSRVLYRAQFTDDYALVNEFVGELVRLALEHAELMREQTRDIWTRLDEDEAVEARDAPDGYHHRRLCNLKAKLHVRQSTLIVTGWNTSRYPLISCTFSVQYPIAALDSTCRVSFAADC